MSLLQFLLIIAFDKVEVSFALLAAECWQHDGLVIMFTFRSNESQCTLDKIDDDDDDEQKALSKIQPELRVRNDDDDNGAADEDDDDEDSSQKTEKRINKDTLCEIVGAGVHSDYFHLSVLLPMLAPPFTVP